VTSWTSPSDLKAQLTRMWDRGDLLRDAVTGNARFPLRLMVKGPTSKEVAEHFDAVRTWVAALANAHPIRLEWQEVRHRVQGSQKLPSQAWIDSMDDALTWLGKWREWRSFAMLLEMTRQQCPLLLPWLEKRSLQALALQSDWSRLLAVVNWLQQHPRPGIYLRQVDLPGVHSKFIERHRAVLAELLDLALPESSVDVTRSGVAQFAARYGFLEKPGRIRCRILDPDIQTIPGTRCPDMALDADSFSRLAIDVRRVLITENETNFLALPLMPEAMAIFGSGYGWDILSRAQWLAACTVHYWGDIDTHGFAILNQLREHFPHVVSILMDRETLNAHRELWGVEDKPQRADLPRLTVEERALYDDLRDNRLGAGVRLEQEHLGFGWVSRMLGQLPR